ncbi:terminase [Chryseobacterium camelliae]|uniref:Terminase n=1 Tax=Chryseobacterium camelliae TaxID=1265445 RepID=A0ABY7QLX1_9FLAO|nr:terminase [Chryseobacterium camelliae]WBV60223.1 terminase [Chryseobacterium camelliae]
MAKKIEENEGRTVGRPSDFKSEYLELAYNYCLLGATDKNLATFFNVCEATINNWKNEYPEFLESIKKGKDIADARIASKLFDRAAGAEIQKQQAFKVKEILYENGKRVKETEKIEVVDITEVIAPDTTAAIFWLKNRKPEYWKDKQEHIVESSVTMKDPPKWNVVDASKK